MHYFHNLFIEFFVSFRQVRFKQLVQQLPGLLIVSAMNSALYFALDGAPQPRPAQFVVLEPVVVD
jgi:hypothetical protein